MTLGQRLKELRYKNDWTLKEVADKLGLSGHSTYSNWEYDRTEPDLEMLKDIAILYDVELDYLLTGNKNTKEGSGFYEEDTDSLINEKLNTIINKLDKINSYDEWQPLVSYCKKENLNPKIVLELIEHSVDVYNILKRKRESDNKLK